MSFTDNTTGRYEWETPQAFFDVLNREFNCTVDVCATPDKAKCKRYFSPEMDGLRQDWTGQVCWMNPPYGRGESGITPWIRKAAQSHAIVVCLIPCRTDTYWWHKWVMTASEIRFIKGRLKFVGAEDGAKFPSAIVVFRGNA